MLRYIDMLVKLLCLQLSEDDRLIHYKGLILIEP